ncbi:MAG: ABC transporter ATP-binding protein [Leptospira sp.]|nr:ABC transporter ATP-binding protein [Leptospira sp.]
MNAIEVKDLFKGYRLYPSRKHLLLSAIPFSRKRYNVKWALRKINLIVQPGESVALLGVNGSGKSTLLQALAGIVTPASGDVRRHGRIAALLELGVGFNMELSGRQNISLTGSLWGYPEKELKEKESEIIDFAEIGEYIDQPVKTYSSGMYVRLAFSIAISVNPDILLVDEALSVGDAYFQSKCYKRLSELKKLGVTLIFVSHDIVTVRQVCDRAVLLHKGRLIADGNVDTVSDLYTALIMTGSNPLKPGKGKRKSLADSKKFPVIYGNRKIEITGYSLERSPSKKKELIPIHEKTPFKIHPFKSEEKVYLSIQIRAKEEIRDSVTTEFIIKDIKGNDLLGSSTYFQNRKVRLKDQETKIIRFELKLNLTHGDYFLNLSTHIGDSNFAGSFHVIEKAACFQIADSIRREFGLARGDIRLLA